MSFFSSRGLNMGLGYFFAIAANMPASEARAIDIRQGSEVADGDMFKATHPGASEQLGSRRTKRS
jgi:hypothetical protein